MEKDRIVQIVQTHFPLEGENVMQCENCLEITNSAEGINVKLILPFNIFEIFIEAVNSAGDTKVKEWDDFYEGNKQEEYELVVKKILERIKNGKIRISEDKKNIECYDGEWKNILL